MSLSTLSAPRPASGPEPAVSSAAPEDMALALRDLFGARNGSGLTRALERLVSACAESGATGEPSPDREAPDGTKISAEIEYAFNRLFVGPGHVPAPPYASVYLDADPQLMGRATASMRELFRSLGLAVREEDNLPEDHLACELEAWLVLQTLARTEDDALRRNVEEALVWLVDGHMQRWIPPFLSRARAESMPKALAQALNCLEAWLSSARNALNRA